MQSDSWIDKYIKLLFPVSNNDLEIDEALKLKYQNTPNSLFKYRAFNDYSLKNFEEDCIWMSNPTNFNDPYDCAVSFESEPLTVSLLRQRINDSRNYCGININEEEILLLKNSNNFVEDLFLITLSKFDNKLDSKNLKLFSQSMNNYFQNEHTKMVENHKRIILDSNYVSCFSENNESILMWSHYADYHKGFCIEYDFKALGISDLRFRFLEPVVYSDDMFELSTYFNSKTILNNSVSIFVSLYASMIKSSEWAYEKEWRIVASNGLFKKEGIFQVPKPKAIYLGVKAIDKEKEKLLLIARKRNIPVFQMRMSHNKFQLFSEQI